MTKDQQAGMPDVAYLSTTTARGGRNGVWSCLQKPKNSRKCEPRISYTRTDIVSAKDAEIAKLQECVRDLADTAYDENGRELPAYQKHAETILAAQREK